MVASLARPRSDLGRLARGRYELLAPLGTGGMATVYRARDARLRREVAIKVIAGRLAHDELSVQRFRREAELCARLGHPNIVAILDVGTEPRDFMVLELVRGSDAATLVEQRGRLAQDDALNAVTQVCDALEHVHDHDLVHRDVSPPNILVRWADGTAKLADFGLACDVAEMPAVRAVDVAGTPGYVAPELLRGGSASPRSDLYSLGAVAHRLLAGPAPGGPGATEPLPSARPSLAPLAEIRPDLPRRVTDAVAQALAGDPQLRQGSAAEFRDQLLHAASAPVELPRAA